MADIFSKEKRSEVMSLIKKKGTKPEMKVFRFLRGEGIYFQKHYDRAPGCPDVALPRKKLAVFIDGDFWHGYRFAAWKDKLPKEYWQEKIAGNIKRDRRNHALLRRAGWRILRVWEHDLTEKRKERTFERIRTFLADGAVGSAPQE